MKVETMVVTPELARKWLGLNTRNRRIRRATVAKYADDMINGRWKLNAETVKLNGDLLIDGQHRLLACVQADVPFVSLVATDVDASVFDTIDRGMGRSFNQVLDINGVKNSSLVAAAARVLWTLETGGSVSSSGDVSIGELEEIIDRYPEVHAIATRAAALKMAIKLIPPGVLAGLWCMFARKSDSLAEFFFVDLNEGSGVYQPVTKLRQRLIIERMGRKRTMPREEVLVITIKAWNAVRLDKTVGVLRWMKTEDITEQRPLIV